jgi:hypothetical protein
MTVNFPPIFFLHSLRTLLGAHLLGERTSISVFAALSLVLLGFDVGHGDLLLSSLVVCGRDGLQEKTSIGMLGITENRLGLSDLDNAAPIHNGKIVADVVRRRQVMGNVQ